MDTANEIEVGTMYYDSKVSPGTEVVRSGTQEDARLKSEFVGKVIWQANFGKSRTVTFEMGKRIK